MGPLGGYMSVRHSSVYCTLIIQKSLKTKQKIISTVNSGIQNIQQPSLYGRYAHYDATLIGGTNCDTVNVIK